LVATGTPLSVTDLASELAGSKLTPTAVFVSNSQTNKTADAAASDWRLAVWAEGFEENVHRHLRDVETMGKRIGLKLEWLRDKSHAQYWDEIRDFALQPERLIYRLAVPRVAVTEVMKAIADWKTADFDPAILSDVAVGTSWIAAAQNQTAASQFAKLTALARERGGHAVMLAGPPVCKEGIDVWGSPPPGLSLMREIKREFDPKEILNPGRFVAGM